MPAAATAIDVSDVLQRMRQAAFTGKDMRPDFTFDVVNAKGETVRWSG